MSDRHGDDRSFRPLWASLSAVFVGLFAVGGTLVVGFTVDASGPASAANHVAFVGLAAIFALLTWRFGAVHATPTPTGLVVRNLVRTRSLAWAQILAVHLSAQDPWVTLDLADGTTLAVMAIQRADGERGMREASRLAELVRARGEAHDEH